MKSVLYLVGVLLLMTSCHIEKLPNTHSPSDPYVQTKGGEKIIGSSVKRNTGIFQRDRIVIDGRAFKPKEVAFYSTGDAVYANIHKKTFALQVAAGKINLYKIVYLVTETSAGGTTHSHHRTQYYIQKTDGAPLKGLNYKNLYAMVTPKTPEAKLLESYRKKRKLSRALSYGSLGSIVGGFGLIVSSSITAGTIGLVMVGVGFLSIYPAMGVSAHNYAKLLKTVLLADKNFDKNKYQKNKDINLLYLVQ